ncbi:hypothetical protein O3P69_003592 [Scylla paramamosain]|uniref:Uncharacterized protein n=1 Tax=Scylla paramamosain TaxID=85552 RepID=A0AAW0UKI3_SCYPA
MNASRCYGRHFPALTKDITSGTPPAGANTFLRVLVTSGGRRKRTTGGLARHFISVEVIGASRRPEWKINYSEFYLPNRLVARRRSGGALSLAALLSCYGTPGAVSEPPTEGP